MDGVDRRRRWNQRMRFKKFACCGSITTWGSSDMDTTHTHTREELEEPAGTGTGMSAGRMQNPDPACAGMNLATALAVERNFRAAQDGSGLIRSIAIGPNLSPNIETEFSGPVRGPLMTLLEFGVNEEREEEMGVAKESQCCVCMGRRKGAAFIPCGHTFCRVCSRELWLNRGCCPLCNRLIVEVLDIY